MPAVDRMLGAIAAFGLGDASGTQSMSPTRDEWRQLRDRLAAERLTGMAALLHGKGVLRLDAESTRELAELDHLWAHHTLRAEDVLLALAARLTDRDVPFRVLKGSSLAELTWRWGEARRWVDADVLVPGDRIDEVVGLCVDDGAVRPVPELRPGYDSRFAKSVTLRSPDGPEIDLHRVVTPEPHSFVVPVADLWADPRPFSVEGTDLSTMSAGATFVHVCMHATIGGTGVRLAALRDAVEAFAHCDLDAAAETASRWMARPMVRRAGELVSARFGLRDHAFVEWSAALPVTDAESRLMEIQVGAAPSQRRRAMASMRYIPTVTDRARYAVAFLVPSAATRRHLGRGRGEQVRRLWRR